MYSYAFNVGFNQAWFHNNYGMQYLDSHFDEAEVERIMRLTQEAHAKTLRLWFFESSNFPMLEWKDEKIVGLKPEYIRNVIQTLRIAQSHNIKVYMTFLDAQAYRPDQLDRTSLKKLRSIYQSEGGANFLKVVIAPLLQHIQDEKLSAVIERIDLSNEMDAIVNRFGFDGGWSGAKRMLCQWREFIQSIEAFKSTPVTFSLRIHPLVIHPLNILSDKGPLSCADYFDFHAYDDRGEILRCSHFKSYAAQKKKPLILGEFGQAFLTHRYDDQLQLKTTINFIQEAKECGFEQALSWRLSDIRPGVNPEARYSFESFNQMRPAYWVIEKNNR